MLVLFALAIAGSASAANPRYVPSNCANHNPPDLSDRARVPIANSRVVCGAVPERLAFYQKFFLGGGDKVAMEKRINDVAAAANSATAAYVAKASGTVDQASARASAADLLAKMRAAKADLDKISSEMQTVGKLIVEDEKKVAAKHPVLTDPIVKARLDFAQLKGRLDQLQQQIDRNNQQKQAMIDSANRLAADPNSQRAAEIQKQRVTQAQALIESQNDAKSKLIKEGLDLKKTVDQLSNADKDVAKDLTAYQQVMRDWEAENKQLKIVSNRVTYADPQTPPEVREAAKNDLALARSSVIGPDGNPLPAPATTGAANGAEAASGPPMTGVERDIAKLTAKSESGEMYQGVFEKQRGDLAAGTADQRAILGNTLAEKVLYNDQQHMMGTVNDSAALLTDDKKIGAVPDNIRQAAEKAQVAYADLTKGDIKGEEAPPNPDAGVMGKLIPSYVPTHEYQARVDKDLKDYNDAMGALSPEEQAYAARLGLPSKLTQGDLAYTTFYSQHSSDTMNTEASTLKGWTTWARDTAVGGAKELYQDATGNRDNAIRDTGLFDIYRNNVAALGSEGQQAGFSRMVMDEQKAQTLTATGDSSTYTGWERATHVTLPNVAYNVLPTSVSDALDFKGTNTIDQQLDRTERADAVAKQSGLAADAEYARDVRSRIEQAHFASTGEVTANSSLDSIQLKKDATIQAGLFNDESDWRWGERKAFWREMVLSSVGGPAGQAIVAQNDTDKATLLRAYANTYQTPELINAANKASAAADSSRNSVLFAGALTATGQTVISGAIMKAAKASYYEATSAAMVARDLSASVRLTDTASRSFEHLGVDANRGGADLARTDLGASSRAQALDGGAFATDRSATHIATVGAEGGHVEASAGVAEHAVSPSAPAALEHVVAPPAVHGVGAANLADGAGATAGRAFLGADHAATQAERGMATAEKFVSPADRPTISAAKATGQPAASASREASTAANAGALGAAHSSASAAAEGADKVAAAIRESVETARKVADPAASVSSSSFLARAADSVGFSGSRVAAESSAGASLAGSALRQGERGTQELERIAGGGASALGTRAASDSAAVARDGGVAARESAVAARPVGTAAEKGERGLASVAAETDRAGAAPATKAGADAALARDVGKAGAGMKDTELAGKEMASAAKDELEGATKAISPRTFAAEAEKMLKPGSKPDRFLDHISSLNAIKAATTKDSAYLAVLAKQEGISSAAYLKKLDRRINYFEHQLHEKFNFPKEYLAQFKEASGVLKPQELADVKRLLTQRAVLESSVAKTLVKSTSKTIEKAMGDAARGGDRAALAAALRNAKVPEQLAARVVEAMDAAKKADRLSDPLLHAAIPAVARDLAGAAVLTKKAPQVGHDLFENLGMAFRPSNGMAVGLAAGMARKYVSNPFVRAGQWIMERPDWFRGVPKYAVKDFTQMELEARLAKASLSSGEKLTADVRRMARVAAETEEADDAVKDALVSQEAAAKAEREARAAREPGLHCDADAEIACSTRYTGFTFGEAIYNRVEQKGLETKIFNMLKDPTKFSREEFYKAASETVSVPSYVEAQGMSKYKVYPRINDALTKLGTPFRALLLDPGTIVHGNELADFIEKSKTAWKDPWELRRAFSEELGTVKVYRGMALTPEEAAKISAEGMSPAWLRDKQFNGAVRALGVPQEAMLKRHMVGETKESLFSSVTRTSPELGLAMANQALEHIKTAKPTAAVYLAEMEVPALDLIHYTADGIPASPSYAGLMHGKVGITYEGKPQSLSRGGPGQESLIYLPIPPEQIKAVNKVEDGTKYGYVMPDKMAGDRARWEGLPGNSTLAAEELAVASPARGLAERVFADVDGDSNAVSAAAPARSLATMSASDIGGLRKPESNPEALRSMYSGVKDTLQSLQADPALSATRKAQVNRAVALLEAPGATIDSLGANTRSDLYRLAYTARREASVAKGADEVAAQTENVLKDFERVVKTADGSAVRVSNDAAVRDAVAAGIHEIEKTPVDLFSPEASKLAATREAAFVAAFDKKMSAAGRTDPHGLGQALARICSAGANCGKTSERVAASTDKLFADVADLEAQFAKMPSDSIAQSLIRKGSGDETVLKFALESPGVDLGAKREAFDRVMNNATVSPAMQKAAANLLDPAKGGAENFQSYVEAFQKQKSFTRSGLDSILAKVPDAKKDAVYEALKSRLAADSTEFQNFMKKVADAPVLSADAGKAERLMKRYAEFSGFDSSVENGRLKTLAERSNGGEPSSMKKAILVETAVTKDLNDTVVKNSAFVTRLMNMHKSMIWDKISHDDFLVKHLVGKYNDFKSMKFAFDVANPEIDRRVSALFEEVNKKYSSFLASVAKDKGWDEYSHGLAAKVGNWNHLGIGATPDEANLAARQSRTMLDAQGHAHPRKFGEVEGAVKAGLDRIRGLREDLSARLGEVKGMFVEEEGKQVLSAEAIEAIRKAKPADDGEAAMAAAVKKSLDARFARDFSGEEISLVRDYAAKVDAFSPDLYLDKRVVIPLGAQGNGIVSADFKGQNARNIEETMKALARTEGQPVSAQIREIRKGEQIATAALEEKKSQFLAAVSKLDPQAHEFVFFSGDDGIYLPSNTLGASEKQRLARDVAGADLRLTYNWHRYSDSGEAIPVNDLSAHIGEAEAVEKNLRKEMIHHFPREQLNRAQLAIDMTPMASGQKHVGVYVGGGNSPAQMDAMQKWVRGYLENGGHTVDFVETLPGSGAKEAAAEGTLLARGDLVYGRKALARLQRERPEMAAAVRYEQAAADALADVRRRVLSGHGSISELDAESARFGKIGTRVIGGDEGARRVGYLAQEEDYLAHQSALAKVNGDVAGGEKLRVEQAAVAAKMLGEDQRRAAELATNADSAGRARRGAVESMRSNVASEAKEWLGHDLTGADQEGKRFLSLLAERDAAAASAAAADARASLESVVVDKLTPASLSAESRQTSAAQLAQDIVDLHAANGAPADLVKLNPTRWNDTLVGACVKEGLCAPKLGARSADAVAHEVSPVVLRVQAEDAIARVGGHAAEDARAAAKLPVAESAEGALARLEADRKALSAETKRIAKDPGLKEIEKATRGALASVEARIAGASVNAAKATDDAVKASKPVSEAERQAKLAAESKKVESELKALTAKGERAPASLAVESLHDRVERGLHGVKGLSAADRKEIANGLEAVANFEKSDSHAQRILEKLRALDTPATRDMLETDAMAFKEAAKALPSKKTWSEAWEEGEKQMLRQSGYSEKEIMEVVEKPNTKFYQHLAHCDLF